MSATRCLTAWNDPIGRPNCSRSLAYSVASSTVRSGDAELQPAREHETLEAQLRGLLGSTHQLAVGQRAGDVADAA